MGHVLLTGATGRIGTALVYCAGFSPIAAVARSGPETWRRTMAVNVASTAELVRLALPALRRSRGHVVFVNASPGMTGVPRWSAFVAGKAAMREPDDSLRE
ncbi:SDR family NAD(P)-dependent oxidoreductase [Nonomuraea turkmeniaca]|uniref:SDR family NAD(P)-dependent oxidoreductase n=1 Tax=Nonomuraea turkmeniaca TaxID=103838 RepID=A0A5S4F658_9ACTN|nr:SDR family NAD(P)-dependent oxidoreductase [Nonomuraea turkmeniaca]TMR11475.1 SDR family NAD(P)-dependent oxidoreductase [Nonomuraea turkmeniaca]